MPISEIGAETAKSWMDAGEAVVLDVREPGEYAASHIPGATLLPLGQACCGALPDYQGKKLVIHCQSGKRGQMACTKLLEETADMELYHLQGGIAAWKEAGLPVESSGSNLLPLDRQVQLAIGVLLILGSVLAATVSSSFLWLTGLIGAGLSVAGLTGFCGLAMVLAKMPWNQAGATSCCAKG